MQSPEEALFSTIRVPASVPVDILHEIFFYSLPPYPTIHAANHIISSLSRVSSTWRVAVISSPRIWSRLLVTLEETDDLRRCAQMVIRWFQHAHSVPLSFFLNINFEAYGDIARIRTFLIDLSSVMLRVRHFALQSRLTTQMLGSFDDLGWKLPQLKKLDLFSHFHEFEPVAFSVPLFHDVPNLVDVAIYNAITSAPDIMHILPWSRLTHVRLIYGISVSRWIEVMNMCPNLRLCAASIYKDEDSHSCSPNGIHRSLERLHLDLLDGSIPFTKLLSLYQLPSLQTLRVLYDTESLFRFPCPQGISTLANIQFFSFNTGGNRFSSKHIEYLAKILREMVNLRKLQLQQTTEEFIPLYRALSFNRPEEAILPRLRTLMLWVPAGSVPDKYVERLPLLKMLSSRCGVDTIPVGFEPLRRFILGVPTEGLHEQMRKLFDPQDRELPSQLECSVDLERDFRVQQPEGWIYPITD